MNAMPVHAAVNRAWVVVIAILGSVHTDTVHTAVIGAFVTVIAGVILVLAFPVMGVTEISGAPVSIIAALCRCYTTAGSGVADIISAAVQIIADNSAMHATSRTRAEINGAGI